MAPLAARFSRFDVLAGGGWLRRLLRLRGHCGIVDAWKIRECQVRGRAAGVGLGGLLLTLRLVPVFLLRVDQSLRMGLRALGLRVPVVLL